MSPKRLFTTALASIKLSVRGTICYFNGITVLWEHIEGALSIEWEEIENNNSAIDFIIS